MAKTSYSFPVESVTGKLSSDRNGDTVIVHRRKCFGKDAKGRPIYGPGETYIYHRHEGKWSEGASKNRELFQKVQILAAQ